MGELNKEIKEHLKKAQSVLKVNFKNEELLYHALTHPSYAYQKNLPFSYESLEFLGDAVLGHIIAEYLFQKFPHLDEGKLSKRRAAIVQEETLARVGEWLNFEGLILVGDELKLDRETRRSLLAEVLEALIGALQLDQGYERTKEFVLINFKPILQGEISLTKDFKSELQERAVALYGEQPLYQIVAIEGQAHRRSFRAEVLLNNKVIGKGCGRSKKKAEQAAAKEALDWLNSVEQSFKKGE
jgi:ribonuclease-3